MFMTFKTLSINKPAKYYSSSKIKCLKNIYLTDESTYLINIKDEKNKKKYRIKEISKDISFLFNQQFSFPTHTPT